MPGRRRCILCVSARHRRNCRERHGNDDADLVKLVLESSDVVHGARQRLLGRPATCRISFACSIEELKDAIGRIRQRSFIKNKDLATIRPTFALDLDQLLDQNAGPRTSDTPSHHSPVAQLVERLTVNQLVAGSSPARGASQRKALTIEGFFRSSVLSARRTHSLQANPPPH